MVNINCSNMIVMVATAAPVVVINIIIIALSFQLYFRMM